MEPVDFPQSNQTLAAPIGMTTCEDMRVHASPEMTISKWRLTPDEAKLAIRNGGVYVYVLAPPNRQPPISVRADDPFLPPPTPTEMEAADRTEMIVGTNTGRVIFECAELLGGQLAMTPDVARDISIAMRRAADEIEPGVEPTSINGIVTVGAVRRAIEALRSKSRKLTNDDTDMDHEGIVALVVDEINAELAQNDVLRRLFRKVGATSA